jgi:hypothetical protein
VKDSFERRLGVATFKLDSSTAEEYWGSSQQWTSPGDVSWNGTAAS